MSGRWNRRGSELKVGDVFEEGDDGLGIGLELMVAEDLEMGDGDNEHFDAYQGVLDGVGDVIDAPWADGGQEAELDAQVDGDALPPREEDDGLDAEELGDGPEAAEGLSDDD